MNLNERDEPFASLALAINLQLTFNVAFHGEYRSSRDALFMFSISNVILNVLD